MAIAVLIPFFFAYPASADNLGQRTTFFVNSFYDRFDRETLGATLYAVSNHAYFYIEDAYLTGLSQFQQNQLKSYVTDLANEFDNVIYPKSRQFWGSEPDPGIDNDSRLTILAHTLTRGTGGYFETKNSATRQQEKDSNEREMITIALDSLGSDTSKIFTAHEFQHLISFNQKEILRGINEEVWLNEVRSQYTLEMLDYNDTLKISDIEQRKQIFRDFASDSLTEWPNRSIDYAIGTMFGIYLTEQFGPGSLSESLQAGGSSIPSIDDFLIKHGHRERFGDIFGNWMIASYINNSSLDSRWGYRNQHLQDLRVPANQTYNLDSASSFVSTMLALEPWQPAWHKINLNLSSDPAKAIKVSFSHAVPMRYFYIDNTGKGGELSNPGFIPFKEGLNSITIMPVNTSKVSGFSVNEPSTELNMRLDIVDMEQFPTEQREDLKNGTLIKRQGETDLYVIEGKYKRFLRPEVIKMYGHLDPAKAVSVSPRVFDLYVTANYVRYVNDQRVYAVWPDGTKHWLNMSAQYFTSSGRDWNAIFIINDLEFNFYRKGVDIRT